MAVPPSTLPASSAGPLQTANALVQRWWVVLARGAIAALFGIAMLASPSWGISALVAAFAIYAFITGALAVGAAYRSGRAGERWYVAALEAAICFAAGIATLVWPGITLTIVTAIVGVWAIGIGVTELSAAIRLRRDIHHEWLLGLAGALSVAFGLVALIRPLFGALAIVSMMGLYLLFFGAGFIALGFRLYQVKRHLPQLSRQVPA